jgi:hypothetical protein
MTTQKCYNCGVEIKTEQKNLTITIKEKTYPVCSTNCKKSADSFLSLIIAEG